MSPLQKGVPARPAGGKTPCFSYFPIIPDVKDGVSDTLYPLKYRYLPRHSCRGVKIERRWDSRLIVVSFSIMCKFNELRMKTINGRRGKRTTPPSDMITSGRLSLSPIQKDLIFNSMLSLPSINGMKTTIRLRQVYIDHWIKRRLKNVFLWD